MVRFSGSAVIVLLVGVQFTLAGPSRCLRDHLHLSDELEVIEHSEQEGSIEDAINATIFAPDDSHYSGPFAETFEQKKPMREIDVELQASANLTAWPAPVNISVSKQKTTRGNLATYEMRWQISPATNLTGFRAVVCTPGCTSTSTTSKQVTLKVPFVIKFNVSVVALYKSPNASKLIERSSKIFEYESGFGPPSSIRKIKAKFEDGERSLKLTWDRPSPPNGPINYYSIHLNDILDGRKSFSMQVTTTEIVFDVTETSGYGFEVVLKAVNIDPSTREELASEDRKYSLIHVKLRKPAKVATVSRSQNSITFQISPPNYRRPFPFRVFFQIKSKAHVQTNYATDLVVVDRLSPYERVTIHVSACYITATFGEYICGDSSRASGTSNIAAPSPISKVDVALSANNETELRWTLPLTRNGPIDGFIVNMRVSSGGPLGEWTKIRDVDFSARAVTIGRGELVEGKSYEFGVAAFNRDLQTSQLHYGTLTVATPPAPPTSPKAWIIPTVVFAVLVVLAGIGLGIHFYVRSGKPLPRVFTSSTT